MKDILRLGAFLKTYAWRIGLAIIASFLSSACLTGFILLVRPIAKEAFLPRAETESVRSAPAAQRSAAASLPEDGRKSGLDGEPPAGQEPDGARSGASAGANAPAGSHDRASPAGGRPGGAQGGEDREAFQPRETVASKVERLKDFGRSIQEGLSSALGIDRLNRWLHGSPFTRVPVLMILLFFLKGFFGYFAEYWLKWVGFRTIQDLRLALYGRVLDQSARFFSTHPTGTLMSRVMGDVGRLQKIASTNLADAVRLVFIVLFMIATVFVISWRMSLICLVALPAVLAPLVRFGRRLKSASRRSQEKAAEVSNVLNETIAGNRIVKAFGMEEFEKGRFRAALVRMFRSDAKALRIVALTSPFLELVGAIFGGALFWYAGVNISRGYLDGPGFVMFLAALGYLFVSLKSLSAMNNDLQQAMAAAARVFELMDTPNEIVERAGAEDLPRFSREVRFEEVTFRYDQTTVLDGINLTARAGEVHALVGSSGAGKTTMVNLIPRFYDVTGGAVTIDGRDVRSLNLASIRRQIALVTQEMILFNDTVRHNIAYGNPAIPLEQVEEAARAAGAHDFVEALPLKYETVIGEQGMRLSAGQRQRVTIARAFLKNAPILILDEATSALDAESEALVQKALEDLMRGRTSIVIAHRLSTIRRADCIHVLEGGRIVEQGRHDELISKGGVYARLCAIQFQDQR